MAVAAVSIVVVTVVVWLLWPSRKPAEQPLARQYRDFNVCLLTDAHGVTGPDAQPMWAGIQDASLAQRVRAQYLSVAGDQNAQNAATFLASLAQGKCDMVFGAGDAQAEAVRTNAHTFPHISFYVINPRTSQPNVSAVDATDVRGSVRRLVTAKVANSPAR
jgi:basic membrane lipoprotein Med (substrate-binding protein (PBP1-ABC) superfamily)